MERENKSAKFRSLVRGRAERREAKVSWLFIDVQRARGRKRRGIESRAELSSAGIRNIVFVQN